LTWNFTVLDVKLVIWKLFLC